MAKELDSGKLMYSPGSNDECYTPLYGVTPILKYIPKDTIVWCPFDTFESHFVREISKTNKVIESHVWTSIITILFILLILIFITLLIFKKGYNLRN